MKPVFRNHKQRRLYVGSTRTYFASLTIWPHTETLFHPISLCSFLTCDRKVVLLTHGWKGGLDGYVLGLLGLLVLMTCQCLMIKLGGCMSFAKLGWRRHFDLLDRWMAW
ncbi:hypothetical protein V8C40DRAFT_234367 [Trichoderma camerunense]